MREKKDNYSMSIGEITPLPEVLSIILLNVATIDQLGLYRFHN